MVELLLIALLGMIVGGLGSLLGIGGGVMLIPLLTSVFNLPIKTAIGASIISVIATSSAAGAVYVKQGIAHTRLGMLLEVTTALGAITGGFTAVFLSPNLLAGVFAILLLYVSYSLGRSKGEESELRPTGLFDTAYLDPSSGQVVHYGIKRLRTGLAASFLAGNLSGLLGIGGGVVKVPVMSLMMGMPMRAAIATSNFLLGITAATTAIIYYQHDYINPQVAIPTALGVLVGAQVGSRFGSRLRSATLRKVFRWLLLVFAVLMIQKAFTL